MISSGVWLYIGILIFKYKNTNIQNTSIKSSNPCSSDMKTFFVCSKFWIMLFSFLEFKINFNCSSFFSITSILDFSDSIFDESNLRVKSGLESLVRMIRSMLSLKSLISAKNLRKKYIMRIRKLGSKRFTNPAQFNQDRVLEQRDIKHISLLIPEVTMD